jgi:NhaP-type Na+/H+ or K+/H+ antiporter
VAVIHFSLAKHTTAKEFLAAVAAGMTVTTVAPQTRQAFHEMGEAAVESLKLGVLLLFGSLLKLERFGQIGVEGYVFAALTLLVARPAAILPVLIKTPLSWRERLTAAWFGPKGFASILYGLMVLHRALPGGRDIITLVALVVAASIVAHSSTDVLIARRFEEPQGEEADEVNEVEKYDAPRSAAELTQRKCG